MDSEQRQLPRALANSVFDVLVEEVGCDQALRPTFQEVACGYGFRHFQFSSVINGERGPRLTLWAHDLRVTAGDKALLRSEQYDHILEASRRIQQLVAEAPGWIPPLRGRLSALAEPKRLAAG